MQIMWRHNQINQTKLDAMENRFDHDEENLYRKKPHQVNFKSPLSKNPLIKKWAVTTYVEDKFFTPHGFILLATRTTSTLSWILGKPLLKPKRVLIHKNDAEAHGPKLMAI